MEFLSTTILSGIIWDLIKSGSYLLSNKLKISLKDWILEENEIEKIVSKVNNSDDIFKRNKRYLEIFLKEDNEIQKILSNLNYEKQSKNENNFARNEGQINIANGHSTINATFNKDIK